MAETDTLSEAFLALELGTAANAPFEITDETPWRRGGAETYALDFRVVGRNGFARHLLLKACVVPPVGRSLSQVVFEWTERRVLLQEHGVIVPTLYSAREATILEEFVPFTLEAVLSRTRAIPDWAIAQGAHLAATLDLLRFNTIALLQDARSHGDDIVLVDFGQDLGPPYVAPHPQGLDPLVRAFQSYGFSMTEEQCRDLNRSYRKSLG